MARVSAERWEKRVRAWGSSGDTAEVFASSRKIDAQQLRWWKWKLARDERSRPTTRPAFVPAHLAGDAGAGARGAVELTFASGVVVRVPAGFSRAALADLIEAIGELSC